MELATGEERPRTPQKVRKLFMVLSPRSLPYAGLALDSLSRNCIDRIHITLITDSPGDKRTLDEFLSSKPKGVGWDVYSASDLDQREQDRFARLPHLRNFRRGHPCWRKITDPLLLSAGKEEMILLDPDLYFPNRFRFEPTPSNGVLLMWQKPSCLWPPEVVETAINAGIRLAHHVDIGVAQWRFPVDLEWLNWLIGQLGSENLPGSMHVEAIVWAALAMRVGGGHLEPTSWLCWQRSQYKRLLRTVGASGTYILRRERLAGVKCFHAGGEAKWWLPGASELGILDQGKEVLAHETIRPFIELTPTQFRAIRRNRRWLQKLGYYSVFRQ